MTEHDKLRQRVAALERTVTELKKVLPVMANHEDRITECERCIDEVFEEEEDDTILEQSSDAEFPELAVDEAER